MISQDISCASPASDAPKIPLTTLTNISEHDTISYAKQRATNSEYTLAQSSVNERLISSLKNDGNEIMLAQLNEIIDKRLLNAIFQPIIHLQSGEIIGYEGLIRGPSDSPMHSPLSLFKVAWANNLTVIVEHLCRRVVLERFAELGLPGKLFLNVSPESLLQRDAKHGETLDYIHEIGINPGNVIIELTESQPTYDYNLLLEAVIHYRNMGFQIAIDDLGEGFSSLRLWSELRPEYVKIDMHFIQGINRDPIKLQFVRSIQEIAEQSGTIVIAEGIETQAELLLIRDLGVACGQGYHIARPHSTPATTLSAEVAKALIRNGVAVYPQKNGFQQNIATVQKLLRKVPTVTSDMLNNEVYELFLNEPDLQVIPVVDNGKPLGLINRINMIEHFARPFERELYGKKFCTFFMNADPLLTEKDTCLQDLSRLITEGDPRHLINGYIIVDQGQYLGMGSGHDLMREITQIQINAARYANPLTQLPGSVPINEHIDRLLQSDTRFCTCYCDLDYFKPYNDVHGYRKGDDVIQMTGKIISDHCDPDRDFIGHIGGDDFIVLFQSDNWEERCRAMLVDFESAIRLYYSIEDLDRGGYVSEDRQGRKIFYSLISLSLGVVKICPGQFYSHHQIATAAVDAKRQAKKINGNSLFIDRRNDPKNGDQKSN